MIVDEIIKHDEGQVPVKVKLASLPSVAQANVNLFDFEDNLQQCLYDMRVIVKVLKLNFNYLSTHERNKKKVRCKVQSEGRFGGHQGARDS